MRERRTAEQATFTTYSAETRLRGGVISFTQLLVWFISEYNSERIIKTGPYCQSYRKIKGGTFLYGPV